MNCFIILIASLYFHKLVSFLTFLRLKLQVSETCSHLLMRLRRAFERARSFQESLEIGYMNENPTTNTPYILIMISSRSCRRCCRIASKLSGTSRERVARESRSGLNFRVASWTLLHPASPMKHLPLWIQPSRIPPYLPARQRLRRRAQARARAPRARKRNSKMGRA